MEDIVRMYAMSDGNPTGEPNELDSDRANDFADEDEEEFETASILTSSDDDEGVSEEAVIVVAEFPMSNRR